MRIKFNSMRGHSNNTYGKIAQTVCECDNIINDSKVLDETRKKVFMDLLYRIKRNCLSIIKLSELEDEDYLAVRLIQRSIIEDLITIYFFLSLTDDAQKFKEALGVLDRKSRDSIEEWLNVHYEIDKMNAHNQGKQYMSKTEYFEAFNTHTQHYCNNDLSYFNRSTTWGFKGNPSAMKSCTSDHELGEPIKFLHTEYRFLSQVEHYCPFNQGFSYFHPNDDTIKIHEKVIDYCMDCLLDEIKDGFNK